MHFDLLSGLNKMQSEAFHELKRRVAMEMNIEDQKDDSIFLRYLRARDYNIDKAELMLRNTLEWRKKSSIDSLETDFTVPEVGKYFPFNRMNLDKEGRPGRLLDFGRTDVKGLLKSVSKDEAVNTVIKYIERDVQTLKDESKKRGKHLETWNFIFDFENYSFLQATHKPTLEFLGTILSIYEANYPERLNQVYIINASIYFTILFAVVKPLLAGTTVSKVKVYGKTGYQEELLKLYEPEALPAYLGGKLTDPDGNPDCLTMVTRGCPVPPSYYFRSPERRLACQPGVKKYSVSRMSKINIILDVPEPGSHIEWEFETESRDIGFGLYYKDAKSTEKPSEIIPKQRVEAHLHSEAGTYQCEVPGTYILMFDNSYSWLSQKEIFCRAGVVTPTNRFIEVAN